MLYLSATCMSGIGANRYWYDCFSTVMHCIQQPFPAMGIGLLEDLMLLL